jgi:LDH2 family malate/lactate/ureidoglycolate dehydrogenase
MNPLNRFPVTRLTEFVTQLFRAAGCDGDKPELIAEGLIEGDLLGHTTHGLQLAAPYLNELQAGRMTATGEPEVLNDRGSTVAWDGTRLPGVWLTTKAIDLALERCKAHGLVTIVIRRSHHIACLAAFLQRATNAGKMIILASSDPAGASVAPFNGIQPLYTPDPLAVGIPTKGDPILIDISASITTNGMASRLQKEGKPLPGEWAMDAQGNPSNDPNVLLTNPPGTLLPTGGLDHGHKGYALALLIETLTQSLGGYGRADEAKGWGASVFLQVIDPEAFGGTEAYLRQSSWLAEACRGCAPRPGVDAVRLPGQRGLEHKRQALKYGLPLYPGIVEALNTHADRLSIEPLSPNYN